MTRPSHQIVKNSKAEQNQDDEENIVVKVESKPIEVNRLRDVKEDAKDNDDDHVQSLRDRFGKKGKRNSQN